MSQNGRDNAKIMDAHPEKLDVYFSQGRIGNYIPRALLVDLEPGVLDSIRASPLGGLFSPDQFIHSQSGAGNNWAKGFYTNGQEIVDDVIDAMRRTVERCDCLQGFQLVGSTGGGTGSGLGSLLLTKIRDEYPDRMIATFTVFPGRVSDTVVEPYNTLLTTNTLINNSDASFAFDNSALYELCDKNLGIKQPTYEHLNTLIARVMSGLTSSLRFGGQLNGDLRKMCVNMVPFPRLHFFSSSYAPLMKEKSKSYSTMKAHEIVTDVFNGKGRMLETQGGKYITCSFIWRGQMSTRQIESVTSEYQMKNAERFIHFLPGHVQTTMTKPHPSIPMSTTFFANSTNFAEVLRRTRETYRKMYDRKAYLHWYAEEGMDEVEFHEAENSLNDLEVEYEMYEVDVDGEVESEARTSSQSAARSSNEPELPKKK